jgi:hypothetical protein
VSGEQAIVVEHRKELTYLLCQAAELEHSLMAQYLFAAFSLRSAPVGPGDSSVATGVRQVTAQMADQIEPV